MYVHLALLISGVDMITACDVRYSSKDSFFEVKVDSMASVERAGG